MVYSEMPQSNGGADFNLVEFKEFNGRRLPYCKIHGAMNKVSPVFWRCIKTSEMKGSCRIGCMEALK